MDDKSRQSTITHSKVLKSLSREMTDIFPICMLEQKWKHQVAFVRSCGSFTIGIKYLVQAQFFYSRVDQVEYRVMPCILIIFLFLEMPNRGDPIYKTFHTSQKFKIFEKWFTKMQCNGRGHFFKDFVVAIFYYEKNSE